MSTALKLLALLLVGCSEFDDATLGSDIVPVSDAGAADADITLAECADVSERFRRFLEQYELADGGISVPSYCSKTPYYPGCPARVLIEEFYDCLSQAIRETTRDN